MKTANEIIKEAKSIAIENFEANDKLINMQYLDMCLRTVMFTEDLVQKKEIAEMNFKITKLALSKGKKN